MIDGSAGRTSATRIDRSPGGDGRVEPMGGPVGHLPGRPVRPVPRAARPRPGRAGRPRWIAAGRPGLARGARCALAEPRDDVREPGHHGRARAAPRLRPRATAVPGTGRHRVGRRPADRAAAVGRRSRPPARLRPARAAVRAVRVPGHLRPVHDDRGGPRHDVRLGPVLRPVRADGHRVRRSRSRGRGPGRRRVRAAAVPDDHRAARERGPGGRSRADVGTRRWASSGRRSCSPATSRAGRRRCRWWSTRSSRVATSTRRSRPPRSS